MGDKKFSELLKTARKKAKLKQYELAEKVGVHKTTISLYESGSREPDVLMIKRLANALNVTGDDLLGTEIDNDATPTAYTVTKPEYEVIQKYNRLDPDKKTTVDTILNLPPTPIKNNLIEFSTEIALYDLPASAGTGSFMFDSNYYEMVELPNVPPKATFAVRVSGDSMQPKYQDRDIVFVKQQPTVNNGEIGIFVLNGEAYIKECGNGELISLNANYEPIKVKEHDTLKCYGKVLN